MPTAAINKGKSKVDEPVSGSLLAGHNLEELENLVPVAGPLRWSAHQPGAQPLASFNPIEYTEFSPEEISSSSPPHPPPHGEKGKSAGITKLKRKLIFALPVDSEFASNSAIPAASSVSKAVPPAVLPSSKAAPSVTPLSKAPLVPKPVAMTKKPGPFKAVSSTAVVLMAQTSSKAVKASKFKPAVPPPAKPRRSMRAAKAVAASVNLLLPPAKVPSRPALSSVVLAKANPPSVAVTKPGLMTVALNTEDSFDDEEFELGLRDLQDLSGDSTGCDTEEGLGEDLGAQNDIEAVDDEVQAEGNSSQIDLKSYIAQKRTRSVTRSFPEPDKASKRNKRVDAPIAPDVSMDIKTIFRNIFGHPSGLNDQAPLKSALKQTSQSATPMAVRSTGLFLPKGGTVTAEAQKDWDTQVKIMTLDGRNMAINRNTYDAFRQLIASAVEELASGPGNQNKEDPDQLMEAPGQDQPGTDHALQDICVTVDRGLEAIIVPDTAHILDLLHQQQIVTEKDVNDLVTIIGISGEALGHLHVDGALSRTPEVVDTLVPDRVKGVLGAGWLSPIGLGALTTKVVRAMKEKAFWKPGGFQLDKETGHVIQNVSTVDNSSDKDLTVLDFLKSLSLFVRTIHFYYVPQRCRRTGSSEASRVADQYEKLFDTIKSKEDLWEQWPAYAKYLNQAFVEDIHVFNKEWFQAISYDHLCRKADFLTQLSTVKTSSSKPLTSSSASCPKAPASSGSGTASKSDLNHSFQNKCWKCGPLNHEGNQHTGETKWVIKKGDRNFMAPTGEHVCIYFNLNSGCNNKAADCKWKHWCSICGDNTRKYGVQKCPQL
ncbi:hypothetical protein C8J56DRAFT_902720 [Mycena floridula]|nr:hypothetical protein C8J56DRAFT_902720 [Mycena floridula]